MCHQSDCSTAPRRTSGSRTRRSGEGHGAFLETSRSVLHASHIRIGNCRPRAGRRRQRRRRAEHQGIIRVHRHLGVSRRGGPRRRSGHLAADGEPDAWRGAAERGVQRQPAAEGHSRQPGVLVLERGRGDSHVRWPRPWHRQGHRRRNHGCGRRRARADSRISRRRRAAPISATSSPTWCTPTAAGPPRWCRARTPRPSRPVPVPGRPARSMRSRPAPA